MSSLNISKEVLKMLDLVEGETTENKVINLVGDSVSQKLKECDGQLVKYESKYGMTFGDFKTAWGKGKIPKRHSHEVERDYLEWEGFQEEKEHWLSTIRKIRIRYYPKG